MTGAFVVPCVLSARNHTQTRVPSSLDPRPIDALGAMHLDAGRAQGPLHAGPTPSAARGPGNRMSRSRHRISPPAVKVAPSSDEVRSVRPP